MKTKSKNEQNKSHTKTTIEWYLTVGHFHGTIYGHSEARKILNVNRITYYRWSTGRAAAPWAALELLRLHAYGEPPSGRSKAWRGFRFQNDLLMTEDGRALSPSDLKAVFFWKQMAMQGLSADEKREIYKELKRIYQTA